MPRRIRAGALPLLIVSLNAGCSDAPRASDGTEVSSSGTADATDVAAPGTEDDGGLFGWIGGLNPFRSDSRAAVESGRVVERIDADGARQVSIDIDLSRGEGPRALLCTVTRRIPASGSADSLDLVTLIVRDDPRRMMLFDDSPAYLVIARERHALSALPPGADSVKRAAEELQARRTYRIPPGLLDQLTRGAPVQVVVSIGGAEVTRTIPGTVCQQIESAGTPRSAAAAPSASGAGETIAQR